MIEYEPKCKCDFCSKDITKYQDYYKNKNYTDFINPKTLVDPFIEHGLGPIPDDHKHIMCRPFRNCHNKSRRPYHWCRENYKQADNRYHLDHDCQITAYPERYKYKEYDMHVDCLKEFINSKRDKLETLDFTKLNTCTIPFTINDCIVNVVSFNLYPLKNSETNIVMEIFLNDINSHNRKQICELMPDEYKNDKIIFDWGHHHPTRHFGRYYPVVTPYGDVIPIPYLGNLDNSICNYCTHHRPNKKLTIAKPCGLKQLEKCIASIKASIELDESNRPPYLYIFEDSEAFINAFADIIIDLFYELVEATEEEPTGPEEPVPVEPEDGHPCPTCGQNIVGNCPVCGNEWPVEEEPTESDTPVVTPEEIDKVFEEDDFFS